MSNHRSQPTPLPPGLRPYSRAAAEAGRCTARQRCLSLQVLLVSSGTRSARGARGRSAGGSPGTSSAGCRRHNAPACGPGAPSSAPLSSRCRRRASLAGSSIARHACRAHTRPGIHIGRQLAHGCAHKSRASCAGSVLGSQVVSASPFPRAGAVQPGAPADPLASASLRQAVG